MDSAADGASRVDPDRPQTVVPAESSQAATGQSQAHPPQIPARAQTSSAAVPPSAPPARVGDVTIKDWEWLAMLLTSVWMAEDPAIQDVVHNHMNEYDAATASGVVRCLIPAREKELRRLTRGSAASVNYVLENIETWVRLFRAGPPSRGYHNPSFSTDSQQSRRQPSVVAQTAGTQPLEQVAGPQPTVELAATVETEGAPAENRQSSEVHISTQQPDTTRFQPVHPSMPGPHGNPFRLHDSFTTQWGHGFDGDPSARPPLHHRRSLDSSADSAVRSEQFAYLRSLENQLKDAELRRTQEQSQYQRSMEARFRDLEARTQRETQRNAFRMQQERADAHSRVLEARVRELEQQLSRQQDEPRSVPQTGGAEATSIHGVLPMMSGGIQGPPQPLGPTQQQTAYGQPPPAASAPMYHSPAAYTAGHSLQPPQNIPGWANQAFPGWSQHFSGAQLSPTQPDQYFAPPQMPQFHSAPQEGQHRGLNASTRAPATQPDTPGNQDTYMPQRYGDAANRRRRIKPEEVMLFDPKEVDVSFFTRRLQVVALQEGEQPVLAALPFCLRGRALEWHTQLPSETQLDMAISLPKSIALLEQEFRRDPLEARREAKLVTFSFDKARTLPLADYLSKKVTLLRAAGTTDSATIKDEIWDGMDHTLAYLAYPRPDESLTDYTARIRAAESGARRTWEAQTARTEGAGPSGSWERLRSVLARLSNNTGRAPVKVEGDGESAARPPRKMARPCRHCGGAHWDNECSAKRVHFAAVDVGESDEEVDLDVLERLVDDLTEPSKK